VAGRFAFPGRARAAPVPRAAQGPPAKRALPAKREPPAKPGPPAKREPPAKQAPAANRGPPAKQAPWAPRVRVAPAECRDRVARARRRRAERVVARGRYAPAPFYRRRPCRAPGPSAAHAGTTVNPAATASHVAAPATIAGCRRTRSFPRTPASRAVTAAARPERARRQTPSTGVARRTVDSLCRPRCGFIKHGVWFHQARER
jgi:hypothetical protein